MESNCGVWVKCSDRLPGYKTPAKWRDGNDHSYATSGKISLFDMEKPNLDNWELLDESGAANDSPDELWDEYSEATDHGIVMSKAGLEKMIEKLKQLK